MHFTFKGHYHLYVKNIMNISTCQLQLSVKCGRWSHAVQLALVRTIILWYLLTYILKSSHSKDNLTFSSKVDLLSKAVLDLVLVLSFPTSYHCIKHVTTVLKHCLIIMFTYSNKQFMGCEAWLAYSRKLFGVFEEILTSKVGRSDLDFGMQSGLLVCLCVQDYKSLCSGYDMFHPG